VAQDILKVILGIDAQMPAGLDQRHKDRGSLTAILSSYEEPVLAPYGQGTNRSLGDFVIQACVGIAQMFLQLWLQPLIIMQCPGELGLWQ
jgi:hypothetical protein